MGVREIYFSRSGQISVEMHTLGGIPSIYFLPVEIQKMITNILKTGRCPDVPHRVELQLFHLVFLFMYWENVPVAQIFKSQHCRTHTLVKFVFYKLERKEGNILNHHKDTSYAGFCRTACKLPHIKATIKNGKNNKQVMLVQGKSQNLYLRIYSFTIIVYLWQGSLMTWRHINLIKTFAHL